MRTTVIEQQKIIKIIINFFKKNFSQGWSPLNDSMTGPGAVSKMTTPRAVGKSFSFSLLEPLTTWQLIPPLPIIRASDLKEQGRSHSIFYGLASEVVIRSSVSCSGKSGTYASQATMQGTW